MTCKSAAPDRCARRKAQFAQWHDQQTRTRRLSDTFCIGLHTRQHRGHNTNLASVGRSHCRFRAPRLPAVTRVAVEGQTGSVMGVHVARQVSGMSKHLLSLQSQSTTKVQAADTQAGLTQRAGSAAIFSKHVSEKRVSRYRCIAADRARSDPPSKLDKQKLSLALTALGGPSTSNSSAHMRVRRGPSCSVGCTAAPATCVRLASPAPDCAFARPCRPAARVSRVSRVMALSAATCGVPRQDCVAGGPRRHFALHNQCVRFRACAEVDARLAHVPLSRTVLTLHETHHSFD